MSLADLMSAMNFEVYAEIALLIFLAVFVAVIIKVFFGDPRAEQRAARIPLDGDEPSNGPQIAVKAEEGCRDHF